MVEKENSAKSDGSVPQNIIEKANERLADYFAVIGLGDDIQAIENAGECNYFALLNNFLIHFWDF